MTDRRNPGLPCPRTRVGVFICCSQCRREHDTSDLVWLQTARRTTPLCTDCVKGGRGKLVRVRVEVVRESADDSDDSEIDADIEKAISASVGDGNRPDRPFCQPGMR